MSCLNPSRLSSQGAAYMNAYCCDMARAAGIGVGNITIGNGSIALGGVGVDLTRLLGLLPEVGSTAADMAVLVTDVVADVANTVVKAVGLPPFKCTIFDWLAFALQNDKRLADRFTKLITAILVSKLNYSDLDCSYMASILPFVASCDCYGA